MNKSVTAMSLVMILFGIVFIAYSIFSFSQVFAIASLLVLIGGAIVMFNGLTSKKYLFVYGECNLTFLEEPVLRKHYAMEHTKDSDQKKN